MLAREKIRFFADDYRDSDFAAARYGTGAGPVSRGQRGASSAGAANQLWQMDFKSPVGWEAPVGPLSVLDDHSRYAIALEGLWSTQPSP